MICDVISKSQNCATKWGVSIHFHSSMKTKWPNGWIILLKIGICSNATECSELWTKAIKFMTLNVLNERNIILTNNNSANLCSFTFNDNVINPFKICMMQIKQNNYYYMSNSQFIQKCQSGPEYQRFYFQAQWSNLIFS